MQKTLDERAITNKPFDYDVQLSLKCQAKPKSVTTNPQILLTSDNIDKEIYFGIYNLGN